MSTKPITCQHETCERNNPNVMRACAECGKLVSNRLNCTRCGKEVCADCAAECARCGEEFCLECLDPCETCDAHLCREHRNYCDGCGDIACPRCLTTASDENEYCPNCLPKHTDTCEDMLQPWNPSPTTIDEMIATLRRARAELGGNAMVVTAFYGDMEGHVGDFEIRTDYTVDGTADEHRCWLKDAEKDDDRVLALMF